MKKENLIKMFPKIQDAVISKYYIAIKTKEKMFSIDTENILDIFDYMATQGYKYVGELGIDCNKFIFQKTGYKSIHSKNK